MAATNLSNPDSLDVLTSMVNQTLIETGRFFKSGGSMQSRAQLKRSLPAAHEQFQSALDELSEQIFIAKAFLERDYEAVRAKKAALQPVEDVVMSEPEAKVEPEATPQHPEQHAVDASPEQIKTESAADVSPQKPPADANAGQQSSGDKPVKVEKSEEGAAAAPSAQPLSAPGDFNFDSMLNDSNGANDFDLNLDFGDDVGNDGFLSGSNLVNTGNDDNTGHDGANNQPSNATTALPGTENPTASAPMGGDAFDLELQKAEAFSAQPGNAGEQSFDGHGGGNMEDVMAPGESSFDDLFMENDNFGGGGGDASLLDGDGLVNITDLDDSWFT
ncbi:hypothetical protein BO70DRAFT_363302 [Aspergillus heteromorphus CBS 117.55]|uniref:Uncharacterized protein n=1 Tax=Aspergillus heteromorphus CBS 117.55 TaxID=1448321 RepID=A0A317VSQ5_9EURO|nr:uncharacterized protein BO70DRAFT_363302 [Aspergillus heteromorphus CBS 117.55]PWY77363.1 hypothetical protein BO70DRAFT_363302 [Aspergillus heteromorphus CBS 117.55]